MKKLLIAIFILWLLGFCDHHRMVRASDWPNNPPIPPARNYSNDPYAIQHDRFMQSFVKKPSLTGIGLLVGLFA